MRVHCGFLLLLLVSLEHVTDRFNVSAQMDQAVQSLTQTRKCSSDSSDSSASDSEDDEAEDPVAADSEVFLTSTMNEINDLDMSDEDDSDSEEEEEELTRMTDGENPFMNNKSDAAPSNVSEPPGFFSSSDADMNSSTQGVSSVLDPFKEMGASMSTAQIPTLSEMSTNVWNAVQGVHQQLASNEEGMKPTSELEVMHTAPVRPNTLHLRNDTNGSISADVKSAEHFLSGLEDAARVSSESVEGRQVSSALARDDTRADTAGAILLGQLSSDVQWRFAKDDEQLRNIINLSTLSDTEKRDLLIRTKRQIQGEQTRRRRIIGIIVTAVVLIVCCVLFVSYVFWIRRRTTESAFDESVMDVHDIATNYDRHEILLKRIGA